MKKHKHWPDILWTGELPIFEKLILNISNILSWCNGSIKKTESMKQATKESYNGKRMDDVKHYDIYAINHYNKIAGELLCELNVRDKNILDLGCGTGILSLQLLKDKPNKVIGVDISESMLEIFQDKILAEGHDPDLIEVKLADAENLPFENDFFDLVVSSMVFGLVPDQGKMLGEMVRVAKPGGVIAIATHGPKHYMEFSKNIINLVPKKYLLGYRVAFWPRNSEQMMKFYQNEELNEIMVKQSTWEDIYSSGTEMLDFATSSSANFWSASIPEKHFPFIMEKLRKHFHSHNLNQLTLDVIYIYGRKR